MRTRAVDSKLCFGPQNRLWRASINEAVRLSRGGLIYFLVVKSVSLSLGLKPPSAAFSHVQAPAGREPQAQALPAGFTFSVEALSQVQSPAGLARQLHLAPVTVFSSAALLQLQ